MLNAEMKCTLTFALLTNVTLRLDWRYRWDWDRWQCIGDSHVRTFTRRNYLSVDFNRVFRKHFRRNVSITRM